MKVPPLPRQTGGPFFQTYTRGLTKIDIERLFTRDTLEAYKFFSRNIDFDELKKQPWHRRMLGRARLLFLAFTLKLTPARRLIYAIALLSSLLGLMELFREVHFLLIPHPAFAPGTLWLLAGFLLVNLLVLLEVADRLSLKNDLEIAREIQQSMLPRAAFKAPGIEAFGMTRPANTVGGDFYDIVPLPDGRVLLALGDVANAHRRRPRRRRPRGATQRADRQTRAATLSIRDALHRDPQSCDRRDVVRQRWTESSAASPGERIVRTPARRWDGARHVRER